MKQEREMGVRTGTGLRMHASGRVPRIDFSSIPWYCVFLWDMERNIHVL